MAVIERIHYGIDKEPMAPSRARITSLTNRVSGHATFDPGCFHYFEFKAASPTQLETKLSRFLELLAAAGGEVLAYVGEPEGSYAGIPTSGYVARITYMVPEPDRALTRAH